MERRLGRDDEGGAVAARPVASFIARAPDHPLPRYAKIAAVLLESIEANNFRNLHGHMDCGPGFNILVGESKLVLPRISAHVYDST